MRKKSPENKETEEKGDKNKHFNHLKEEAEKTGEERGRGERESSSTYNKNSVTKRRFRYKVPYAAIHYRISSGRVYEYLLKLAFSVLYRLLAGLGAGAFLPAFISGNNPERKWINPGFCVGPYVPLYGTGLCIFVSGLPVWQKAGRAAAPCGTILLMLLLMAAAMTAIEYIAGIMTLKVMHARLWDYSRRWGNIDGLICPVVFGNLGGNGRSLLFFFVDPYIFAGAGLAFPQSGVFLCHRGYSSASLPSTLSTPRI